MENGNRRKIKNITVFDKFCQYPQQHQLILSTHVYSSVIGGDYSAVIDDVFIIRCKNPQKNVEMVTTVCGFVRQCRKSVVVV